MLGVKSYVCQVCSLYAQTQKKIADVYEESKRAAEKKIKDKAIALDNLEIEELSDVDVSVDEFNEEETVPEKFEKRKAGKTDISDGEDFAEVECPFCGELYDDLPSHIQNCEFAPDDASIDDILPKKRKKRKAKGKPGTTKTKGESDSSDEDKEKQKCPYCGKEFLRLGRHLNSCKKKPGGAKDADDDEEDDDDDYDD